MFKKLHCIAILVVSIIAIPQGGLLSTEDNVASLPESIDADAEKDTTSLVPRSIGSNTGIEQGMFQDLY